MDWKDYAQKQDCAFRATRKPRRFFLELSGTDVHSHAIAESLEKNGVGPWRPVTTSVLSPRNGAMVIRIFAGRRTAWGARSAGRRILPPPTAPGTGGC